MRYLNKFLLALVLLCVASTGNAQLVPGEAPLHAGATTSKAFGSIISNPFGSPSAGDRVLFATPGNNCVLITNGSEAPSCSTTLPNGLAMGTPASLDLSNAALNAGSSSITNGHNNGLIYQDGTGKFNVTTSLPNAVAITNGSSVPGLATTLPDGLAMGTPASLNLANATGLPAMGFTIGSGSTPTSGFTSGHVVGVSGGKTTDFSVSGSGTTVALTTSPSFTTPSLGAATFASMSDAASWPGSFGTTPTSISFINHNSFPTAGMIPAGVLQQFSGAMVVPASYAQAPWPNVNFAAYAENQGTSPGQSVANYFGISTVSASGYGVNLNGVVSNASAAHALSGAGLGNNFGQLVGVEINPNIWKVGASAPTGALDGIRLIGGGDNTNPTGGSFGVRFFPLAGYGTGTVTYWTYLNYSEDGAASTPANNSYFASMGSTGTGNSVHSQAIQGRARDAGGVVRGGYLQYAFTNNWYVNPAVFIGASTGAMDTNALLQTYAAANSLQIEAVIRNDNGGSPTAALGFNVASSSSLETSVSKGGIGFTRTAAQGGGYGSLYNRAAADANPFTTTDEVFRWTSGGIQSFGTTLLSGALTYGGVTLGNSFTGSAGSSMVGSISPTFTGTVSIAAANSATTSALCYNTGTGAITYNGTVGTCTTSAMAFKDPLGFVNDNDVLSGLDALRPAVWQYKDDGTGALDRKVRVGLYADDVEKMDKRCAAYRDGKLVDYEDRCVIAYLAGALKDLKAEVSLLRTSK